MALMTRSTLPDDSVVRQIARGTEIDLGDIRAFLGEGTQFKGEVRFTGTIRIDGIVEGELICGEVLIVGEPAQVKAKIEVGSLDICGQVEGDITARQRVQLLAGSRVIGIIRTPRLVISEGAVFDGRCEMPSTKKGGVEGS
jgi:cytoskeletal protein CcmA (bactofilin family)